MERKLVAGAGGGLGGGEIEQKRKRTHGQGEECGDFAVLGLVDVEQDIRGINGPGKIQLK